MKPLVNLSSTPFRNRRLFWLSILLLFGLSAFFGYKTLENINSLDKEVSRLEPEAEKKEKEAKALQPVTAEGQALSVDQTIAMLAADRLIQRKSFSWTHLLSEIERLVPSTVRVRKITINGIENPGATNKANSDSLLNAGEKEGNIVTLSIDVTGRNVQEVLKMIESFNHSGRFEVFARKETTLDGTDEVEFELQVIYRPPVVRRMLSAAPTNQIAKGGN